MSSRKGRLEEGYASTCHGRVEDLYQVLDDVEFFALEVALKQRVTRRCHLKEGVGRCVTSNSPTDPDEKDCCAKDKQKERQPPQSKPEALSHRSSLS
ncbi:hypothetical protein BaRGS_00024258, partial [Batillaria attramentaria]